jgi:hypothetical protein
MAFSPPPVATTPNSASPVDVILPLEARPLNRASVPASAALEPCGKLRSLGRYEQFRTSLLGFLLNLLERTECPEVMNDETDQNSGTEYESKGQFSRQAHVVPHVDLLQL